MGTPLYPACVSIRSRALQDSTSLPQPLKGGNVHADQFAKLHARSVKNEYFRCCDSSSLLA